MNTYKIDNDIIINTCSNFDNDSKNLSYNTNINFIQFHFCLEGHITLNYNNGAYKLQLKENENSKPFWIVNYHMPCVWRHPEVMILHITYFKKFVEKY